ncbi:MAG: DUF6065 family protein [Planctomycetota bacterium]
MIENNSQRSPVDEIVAYEIPGRTEMPLIPASPARLWMDTANGPRDRSVTLANRSGWLICSPCSFSIRWNGGEAPHDVAFAFDEPADAGVVSIFGQGIVTFDLPYMFQTPRHIDLWLRGPTNIPKDGAWPIEAVVQTDRKLSNLSMNWKVTRAEHVVRFERGEPFCTVVPFPAKLLDGLHPKRAPLNTTVVGGAEASPTADEEAQNTGSESTSEQTVGPLRPFVTSSM